MIDNIFLGSKLTGQTTNKIIIDDISDHLPCVTILENLLPSKSNKREITSRDIRPMNLEALNAELKLSIPNLRSDTDVNSQFNDFHLLLQSSIQKHCPYKTRTINKRKFRKEPWLTHGLLISSHKQKVLYQASLRRDAHTSSVTKYKEYRNLLTKLKRKCKLNYFRDKCNEYRTNVKNYGRLLILVLGSNRTKPI